MTMVWLRRTMIVLIGALMLLPLPQTAATGEPPPPAAPTRSTDLPTAP